MTIKMKTGLAGVDFSLKPGDETDRFSAKEEARLIDAGYAERVNGKKTDPKPATETTSKAPAPETRG